MTTFLKTSIRHLLKNGTYSFLNIFGLAVGIACAALIFLWVEDEVKWDVVHAKKDNIYYIQENQKYDTYTATFSSTPAPLGPAMLAEIPGIAYVCRTNEGADNKLFKIGDKSVYSSGKYAEPSLFSMFSLHFVEGNAATAFKDLYSIVLTQKTAKKFFGDETNVLGKTVRMANKQDYVVTGVLKDIPQNSSMKFEWVAPFQVWYNASQPWATYWGNNCLSTYVELKPGADPAAIDKKLYDFIQKREPKSIARPFLWNMNKWHLYSEFDNGIATGGGQIQYVRLFSAIAWIILLIACINFMNLATARSEKRAKEVGVKKVLGAQKKSLVIQFIGEALIMASLSTILAVIMIYLSIPAFNQLVQRELSVGLEQPLHLLSLLAITLVCGLIAGSYPSLYLSSFNPVSTLKSINIKGGSAAFVRQGLVVLQFTTSIVLIISTIIIYQQIQHVKSRDLGFNKSNLLQTDVVGDVAQNYDAIKQELLNTRMVESVAMTDYATLYDGNNTGGLTWEGKASEAQILISGRYITPEYIKTTQMKLLSGRDFIHSDSVTSKRKNVIITRSLEKLMGDGSAVGKVLWHSGETAEERTVQHIVGVVDDYVYGNMYGKPDPVVFFCTAPKNTNVMYIRLKNNNSAEDALSVIGAVFKKENPAYPFNYLFVDEQFNRLFGNEMLISKLSKVFAALAIVISCLGLFGLAAYTAERRKKEIGIRKILGSTAASLAGLLSKDFLKLVVISCVIAFPVAWWVMHNWLLDYQYRISINWLIFLISGLVALLVALITVSFQAVKTAMMNPVKSLRTE